MDAGVPVAGDPHGRGQPRLARRSGDGRAAGRGRRPADRSPVRLAEAGPWWDITPDGRSPADAELKDLDARLAELDGRRPTLQAQARAELAREGVPVTRSTVTRRAVQILDRSQEPA
jgi:hypothetical protein